MGGVHIGGGIMLEAIITGAVAIVVCMLNNYFQNRKSTALIEYKIDELSKRVDKHNSLVERTYKLEETVSVLEEKIKVENHRIEDLENLERK